MVFNNTPDSYRYMLGGKNRVLPYPQPASLYDLPFVTPHARVNTPLRAGNTLKDAALRSLHRKADVGLRGSAPHSRLGADVNLANALSANGNTYSIRMRGRDSRYEPYQALAQRAPMPDLKRRQLRESNDRLRALQELDRRREDQLKKEFAALEVKRKQQDEETQRRINIKKVRLAETGYINMSASPVIRERFGTREANRPQDRFIALARTWM